jgi:hypothetical protein
MRTYMILSFKMPIALAQLRSSKKPNYTSALFCFDWDLVLLIRLPLSTSDSKTYPGQEPDADLVTAHAKFVELPGDQYLRLSPIATCDTAAIVTGHITRASFHGADVFRAPHCSYRTSHRNHLSLLARMPPSLALSPLPNAHTQPPLLCPVVPPLYENQDTHALIKAAFLSNNVKCRSAFPFK